METITTAVTTALSGVSTDAMAMIGTVLPFGLAIVGAQLVVAIGISFFKKVTGKQ